MKTSVEPQPCMPVRLPDGSRVLVDPCRLRYLITEKSGAVHSIVETPLKRIVSAMMMSPYSLEMYADELDIPVQQVRDWVLGAHTTGGLDMRGRIPIEYGSPFTSTSGADGRPTSALVVDWMEEENAEGHAVFAPDWTEGDDLIGRYQAGMGSPAKASHQRGNLLSNLPHMTRGIKDMPMPEPGKPALLLACGPSLADAYPFIEQLQGQATIMTCNRGLQLLDPGHIDYYAAVDHVGRTSWLERAKDLRGSAALWVATHPMFREALSAEKTFWFASPLNSVEMQEEQTERERLGMVAGGTTVAIHMLYIAWRYFRANPIILCGYDLSAINGMYYPDVPATPENVPSACVETTHAGDLRITCRMFQSQRRQMDGQLFWLLDKAQPKVRIINASRGIVRGGEHMTMAQAVEEIGRGG